MTILVVVDVCCARTEKDKVHLKNTTERVLDVLSATNRVEFAYAADAVCKCSWYNFVVPESTSEFNPSAFDDLQYTKVLLITGEKRKISAKNVKLMVLDFNNPQELPLVGFVCSNCKRERSRHHSGDAMCPSARGYYSTEKSFSPNLAKPVYRFIL